MIDPVSTILDISSKIIDRLWPNPAERDAAKLKLLELQQSGELAALAAETDLAKGQQEINKIEAASQNLFIAGWRPFIGWTCGVAFAFAYVMRPFLEFMLTASGHPVVLPNVNFSELLPILLGMLGLGGMRTYEKVKKVTK